MNEHEQAQTSADVHKQELMGRWARQMRTDEEKAYW